MQGPTPGGVLVNGLPSRSAAKATKDLAMLAEAGKSLCRAINDAAATSVLRRAKTSCAT